MMMSTLPLSVVHGLILSVGVAGTAVADSGLILSAETCALEIDTVGQVRSFVTTGGDANLISRQASSPLLRIRSREGRYESPTTCLWDQSTDDRWTIRLGYESGTTAEITARTERSYLAFELKSVAGGSPVEEVAWGPFYTTLADQIGEAVGVVQGQGQAVGLQALNIKTIGGSPFTERRRLSNTAERVDAETSRLQAWSQDRTREKVVEAWGQQGIRRLPVPGETVTGSEIALFACRSDRALDVIGEIELNEGLPHPMLDGIWLKKSPEATSLKFIVSFSERNIEDCVQLAQEAGVTCVYHPGIFESWGHYAPRSNQFPDGLETVQYCVEVAEEAGVTLGAHTLSCFLHPGDAFVTPVPDRRLALQHHFSLPRDLPVDARTIPVADDVDVSLFKEPNAQTLTVIRIGDELIQYGGVSETNPRALVNCTRGAFGTQAADHLQGAAVARVMSHPYKVFFPDINMLEDVATNLAAFFNQSGLRRMSLDGFEGTLAAGHGIYGYELFAKTFYDRLENKAIINNSSDLTHYYWHICTNESWGEPWTGSFREAHLDHRIQSVRHMQANLMPAKMGQYRIGKDTKVSDVNWLMGLCAGLDAGVDFYVHPSLKRRNPDMEGILATIRSWETVRRAGTLSDEQKRLLQQHHHEYQLTFDGDQRPVLSLLGAWGTGSAERRHAPVNTLDSAFWHLDRVSKAFRVTHDYRHVHLVKEPGQPTNAAWKIQNPGSDQVARFVLRAAAEGDAELTNVTLSIAGRPIAVDAVLKNGEYLAVNGTGTMVHYGQDHSVIRSEAISAPVFPGGASVVEADYEVAPADSRSSIVVNFGFVADAQP